MKINIIYFASLKDQSNKSNEKIQTESKTVDDLFNELNVKYSFKVPKNNLRVAINEEYKEFSSKLNENDTVVFIPPVAGG
jgi:molybdopterin converting factor subunit 1